MHHSSHSPSLLLCSLLSPLLLLCVFQFLRYLFTFFHYYYSYSVVSVSVSVSVFVSVSTSSPSPHPVFSILFVVVIISKALTYLSSFRFVAYPLHTGYTNCVGETHLKGIPECEREREKDLSTAPVSAYIRSHLLLLISTGIFSAWVDPLSFVTCFKSISSSFLSIYRICVSVCVFIFEFICLLSFHFVSFLHFLLGHLIIIQIFYLDTHSDLSSSHSYRAITTTTTTTTSTHTHGSKFVRSTFGVGFSWVSFFCV